MRPALDGTNRTGGRNPFAWAEYDGLPPAVRRVIMFAPTSLGSRRARMNLLKGRTVAEVCAIERGVAIGITRRDILEAYGPDHPFLSKAHVA
ncbi:hypothetical protein ACFPIF_19485 [Brevundimonas faecalis]|uniref:hypothetical protein n=1 Tax=Brevundimonas faecalis TaxID=947378 RepID=UPI00361A0EC8